MSISPKMKMALTWTGQILLGVLFIMSGLGNMLEGPHVTARFERWGYPGEFRYVVATIELLGAVGLLFPRTARYAALGLIGLMIGAFGTHLFNDQYSRLVVNVVIGLILFGIAFSRRGPGNFRGPSEPPDD